MTDESHIKFSPLSAWLHRLDEYVDFRTRLTREELKIQPYCNPDLPTSMHTLDHIPAMAQRRELTYEAEQGLKEVKIVMGVSSRTTKIKPM